MLVVILTFVLVSEFDYDLPEELIAQEPLADRAASRMLVVSRSDGTLTDSVFREFPSYLSEGDCLILNDSKVFPSRLLGIRSSGTARVEVFLVEPVSEDNRTWLALVRPGRKLPVGEHIRFAGGVSCEILGRAEQGRRILHFDGTADVFGFLDEHGHTPLPPYIRRMDRPDERNRYNTTFAAATGSVAAPTAGLHFTPEILDQCRNAGVAIASVTLHVGLGTFAPLRAEKVEEVRLHPERYAITAEALHSIRQAKRRICVGTTSVRVVETVFQRERLVGNTDIFIAPGFSFRAVDILLTNFHLPQSSLLLLVSAFAGRELALAACNHAVHERYRFFSYGDCMLIS